jgi:hypothetical protein
VVLVTVQDGYDRNGPSTTYEWRKVKICESSHPEGTARQRRSAPPRRTRDQWKPQTIEVRYRGGPESSWLIRFGSIYLRFPGWMCLDDVMRKLAQTGQMGSTWSPEGNR